mgnify:CR=1 FL=1
MFDECNFDVLDEFEKPEDINNFLTFENLYKDYKRIVNNPKDKSSITKDIMYEEVLNEYNNYNNIISICSYEELEYLRKYIENKDMRDEKLYNELDYKFLLFNYPTNEMNEKLKNNIIEALKHVDIEKVKRNDRINFFILGYIKVMGIVNLVDVALLLVKQGYFDNEDDALNHIKYNKYFNYYVELNVSDLMYYDDYEEYLSSYELLLENRKKMIHFPLEKIDEEAYITIFKHNFNINVPEVKAMIDELNKYAALYAIIKDTILKTILCGRANEDLIMETLRNYNNTNRIKKINKVYNIIIEGINNSQSGYLYGLTFNEYNEKLAKRNQDSLL